jgi:hypothetical protein
MTQADLGLTGKLDQVAPDSFRVRKTLPSPRLVIRQKMDRNITPLNFVASAVQRFNEACRRIIAAPPGKNSDNLTQAGRSGSLRYEH